MAFEYNDKRKETGVDVELQLPGALNSIAVSNVSFTEEVDTSEVQFNNSYTTDYAVTGVTYSGSFDIPGRDNPLRDYLWSGDPENEETIGTTMPRYFDAMGIIDGSGKTYLFQRVLITSHSKDAPADDRTEESYDFVAEKLVTGASDLATGI